MKKSLKAGFLGVSIIFFAGMLTSLTIVDHLAKESAWSGHGIFYFIAFTGVTIGCAVLYFAHLERYNEERKSGDEVFRKNTSTSAF